MEKTVTINIIDSYNSHLGTPCIVCDETVLLTEEEEITLRYGHHIHRKICDKCKAAILHMREQMH